ncbi:MAG: SDR family oxidoreductase [Candidatus Sedimenticola sp. 1PA]
MEKTRTVLVTGASRGIGRAICNKLLAEGCHVIGLARSMGTDDNQPGGFTPLEIDLSDLTSLPERLKQIRRSHPQIDGVICNAGFGRFGSIEEFSPTQIQELIDLNLTSQILVAREFIPALKKEHRGDFILMGSESALSGGKKGAVYSATKFALRGLAQSLREECAGNGVRVGIINPGMVQSGFFDELDFAPGTCDDNHLKPEDVAEAVWLMLSARMGAAIDEINLSPQKKVIQFGKGK